MMNIGNTALTPISEELTPTFSGWTDETFDKVLIGGGKTNLTNGLIAHYKFDGDFIESQAFAYLAIRSYLGLPITFPNTTGCKESISGGEIVENF